jgi:hypothetical protein
MKVPEIMEKAVGKMMGMKGLNYVPVNAVIFGIRVKVELSVEEFSGFIRMLLSEGFEFNNMSVGVDGDITEIYRNKNTHEVVAIKYVEGEKYLIGDITYYWKE